MKMSTFLDKKIVFSLLILVVGFVADPVLAACPSSGLAASSGATDINGDCAVVGDINLSGSATLTMSNGNLSVTGKIILQENSVPSVTTATLTFPQTNFSQYSIKLNGQSQFIMTDSTFVTNATIQNPTEVYPFDASKISVSSSSFATTWLNFAPGNTGIVNIPKLDDQAKFYIYT